MRPPTLNLQQLSWTWWVAFATAVCTVDEMEQDSHEGDNQNRQMHTMRTRSAIGNQTEHSGGTGLASAAVVSRSYTLKT